jgi:hypothetical protein
MNDAKDSLANATTLAGSGAVIMNFNEALTLVLIVTGIVLNIVRIMAVRSKEDK